VVKKEGIKMANGTEIQGKDLRFGLTHKKSLGFSAYTIALIAIMGGLALIQTNLWAVVALITVVTELSVVTSIFIGLQYILDKMKITKGETKV
jgi:hypothetical protein